MPLTAEQNPISQAQTWTRHQLYIASVATAYRLADMYTVSDIECHGIQVMLDGRRWYDIGALFDPWEVSSEMIDMWSQAIAYALGRNLIEMHPDAPHLVRKLVQP